MLQTHDFPFEVRSVEEAGTFRGFASTFGGDPDSYGDTIAAGAFAKSLAEHKSAGTVPAMLWSHDTGQPVGKWTEMRETNTGLEVTGKLTLEVARAREALALVKDGALTGLSIGFQTRASKRNGNGRTLTDIVLHEISLVAMPANQSARITEARAAFARGGVPGLVDFERLIYERMRDDGLSRRQIKALLRDGYAGLAPEAVELEDLCASIERVTKVLR